MSESEGDPYETVKARSPSIALSLAGRDIGELPEIAKSEGKTRTASEFRLFGEQYFPLTFHLSGRRTT